MAIIERVTLRSFEKKILKSAIPVLVEFRTSSCESCQEIEPILERLAGDLRGKVRIAQVDVEADPQLGMAFAIRYVPTLGLFQDGRLTGMQVGVPSTDALEAALRRVA